MNEIWKSVIGYEGYYKVSNMGNVCSVNREYINKAGRKHKVKSKLLSKQKMTIGYYKVDLSVNGNRFSISIHRLVAQAFISNPKNKPTVNHKDGIKTNNYYKNLEWATYSENNKHAHETGLKQPTWKGKFNTDNPNSIPVVQYTKEGNFIKEYGSMREASRQTNICYKHMPDVCKGRRKSAGGFIWKYVHNI